ncbi:MAG: serpin family protein [Bacteroidales bacterium]|nr:serpin family protein [Bacteroidales bacterium]
MKKKLFYIAFISLWGCVVSCNKESGDNPIDAELAKPIELTLKQAERASLDNRFSFVMFQNVAKTNANTFFSPLSLNMALGMLYNGTTGDTRDEMAEVFGVTGFTDKEFNEYYRKMSEALQDIDPLTEIQLANSIWYLTGFPVKKPFLDVNQQYFDAQVKDLDFSDSKAADIINNWCAEKTKDRITKIVNNPIPDEVVMYLINAVYFKSQWKFAFEKSQSRESDFTLESGKKEKVTLMEQTITLPYYADEHIQCVEMPYGNQAFSMVAILPQEGRTMEQLRDYLDNDTWKAISGKFYQQNIYLKLPRFKIECDLPLKEPVYDAGLKLIFSGGFNNISDKKLRVSEIKQKTFVEVNEEGTEAAAATVIGFEVTSVPPDQSAVPVPFFADRPFLYLIKEKSTGVILFIGRMDEPKE